MIIRDPRIELDKNYNIKQRKQRKQTTMAEQNTIQTTITGENFYKSPLETFDAGKTIGLPGIGEKGTKQLKKIGIVHAYQLFGQYLAFSRDRNIFIAYLAQNNININKPELEDALIATLDAKYEKIKDKLNDTDAENYDFIVE
jgi:hypothetical protein